LSSNKKLTTSLGGSQNEGFDIIRHGPALKEKGD